MKIIMFYWNVLLNFLIETITIKWVAIFFIIYYLILWISVFLWVINDISNRTDKLFLQILSVIIIFLLGPLWIIIYFIIRPKKTLIEKSYEEIECNLEILMDDILKKIEKKKKKKKKL